MLKVLLIEDEEDDVILTRRALRDCPDLTLTTAGTASEAIDLVAAMVEEGEALPDIVLCDLKLPGMCGPELVGLLRGSGYFDCIPIVAHTSYADAKTLAEFYAAGGTALISKSASNYETLAQNLPLWAKSEAVEYGRKSA